MIGKTAVVTCDQPSEPIGVGESGEVVAFGEGLVTVRFEIGETTEDIELLGGDVEILYGGTGSPAGSVAGGRKFSRFDLAAGASARGWYTPRFWIDASAKGKFLGAFSIFWQADKMTLRDEYNTLGMHFADLRGWLEQEGSMATPEDLQVALISFGVADVTNRTQPAEGPAGGAGRRG